MDASVRSVDEVLALHERWGASRYDEAVAVPELASYRPLLDALAGA